jgi:hypothetical protein
MTNKQYANKNVIKIRLSNVFVMNGAAWFLSIVETYDFIRLNHGERTVGLLTIATMLIFERFINTRF